MSKPLNEIFSVTGRFHRSVQIVKDWQSGLSLESYLLTPTCKELALQILEGITDKEQPSRAFSLTGPYGTGKSAFALFLTDLLGNATPFHQQATQLRKTSSINDSKYLPILLTGQRSGISEGILHALQNSFAYHQITPPVVIEDVSTYPVTGDQLVSLVEAFSNAAISAEYDGLLIIVDEFGKFLEYSVDNPQHSDIFVLQQLAEAAVRSSSPFIFITILHAAFADYASALSEVQQQEWQKIQGRFTDLLLLEPPENMLRIVAAAISATDPLVAKAYQDQSAKITSTAMPAETRLRLPVDSLLPEIAPLNPFAGLLLWPLFRSKLAQNERSLFSFLTSAEPYSFKDYLKTTTIDTSKPRLFALDDLYQYVVTSLGSAIFMGAGGQAWAEIDHALARIPANAPKQCQAIVQAIGLLRNFGREVGLYPTKHVLENSISSLEGFEEALIYLEQKANIIVHRRYEDSYALWEGSDVDLDECYQKAKNKLAVHNLADRLARFVDIRPFVAKGHYIRSGTLRYFDVSVYEGSPSSLQELVQLEPETADGQIFFLLSKSDKEREDYIAKAKALTILPGAEQLIFAFPRPISGLEAALYELDLWEAVQKDTPAIQSDPVAKRELKSRIRYYQRQIQTIAGGVFGLTGHLFRPDLSTWIYAGQKVLELSNTTLFTRWLSSLCDQIFPDAPYLYNELLNRDSLSSAAAAARRKLIDHMLDGLDQPKLGITGAPPQYSMYASMLQSGGFHRKAEETYIFADPTEKQWLPAWSMISKFLDSTRHGRKPLTDLIAKLKAPPFGMREGPIPVLIAAYLIMHRNSVAIYEESVFTPALRIEVFERLLRKPSIFELQLHQLDDLGHQTYSAVNSVMSELALIDSDDEVSGLLDLVRPLILFIGKQPQYTQKTKRISDQALAVRAKLLTAKDPKQLVFDHLPEALGISIESQDAVKVFTKDLESTLRELSTAYPKLLDNIEDQVRNVFDLQGSFEEARQILQKRAAPLSGLAAERVLAQFVREATMFSASSDWREAIGRILKGGQPPKVWRDPDLVIFQANLRQVASDFMRLEELAAEQKRSGSAKVFRVGILNGTVGETRQTISISQNQVEAVDAVALKLETALYQYVSDETDHSQQDDAIYMAAVAQLAEKLIRDLKHKDNNE